MDTKFFEEVAKKMHIPKGSMKPHPDDWMGLGGAPTGIVLPVDFNKPVKIRGTDKRRRLTKRQKKLAELILKGYTPRQAKIRAGYSLGVHRTNGRELSPVVKSFIQDMQERVIGVGVTEDVIAHKFTEWINASKQISTRHGGKANEETDDFIEVPDYDVQLKAYDRWKEIMQPKDASGGKKRQMTITEWLDEGDNG